MEERLQICVKEELRKLKNHFHMFECSVSTMCCSRKPICAVVVTMQHICAVVSVKQENIVRSQTLLQNVVDSVYFLVS